MSEDTVKCKFCAQELMPVGWNGSRELPRHSEAENQRYACQGSGMRLEKAVAGHAEIVETAEAAMGGIRLNPKLANSNLENRYGE